MVKPIQNPFQIKNIHNQRVSGMIGKQELKKEKENIFSLECKEA
jgi:hypothetical protein